MKFLEMILLFKTNWAYIYIKLQESQLSQVRYLCVRLQKHVCVRRQQVDVCLKHMHVPLHTQVGDRLQQVGARLQQ